MNKYKAGVVGFSGYSGQELVRLLGAHPQSEPILLEHRQDQERRPSPVNHPQPRRATCTPEAVREEGLDVVFLATPPDVSMELAPVMLEAGAKVIDLSGAFRLRDGATYARWYKQEHTVPALFAEAAYGLPEYCRHRIRSARLIANPGCYPTAANLAIQPLIASGGIDRSAGIVCDAKSGVSGAGRKPTLKTSFCEVADNFSVYSVFDHRHVAEVLLVSGLEEPEFSFIAQLLPIDRGILETIYVRTRNITSAEQLLDVYLRHYQGEKFVRLYTPGQLPDLSGVNRTNFCDIGFQFDRATGRAVIVSAIDNLVKGAAGQAIQNMNLILGCDETAGLL
jgi:N-acetyl-gamma-glutamyl-phosphate reductase